MPTPKQTYSSPRQLARKAAILESTRELLTKRGYEGTTVRDVAERAGVAKGTLYNLYGGKDELIFSAVVDLLETIRERANAHPSSSGIDHLLFLDEITQEVIAGAPAYAEAMTRALWRSKPDDLLVDGLMNSARITTRQEILAAIENGEIRADVDPDVLAVQIESQRWGLIMHWILGAVPLDDLASRTQRGLLAVFLSVATDATKPRLQDRLNALS